jgi:hypothetical protein
VNAYRANTDQGTTTPMTREEWIAFHVARAPQITPQQWADTLLLLLTRNQRHDDREHEEKAG